MVNKLRSRNISTKLLVTTLILFATLVSGLFLTIYHLKVKIRQTKNLDIPIVELGAKNNFLSRDILHRVEILKYRFDPQQLNQLEKDVVNLEKGIIKYNQIINHYNAEGYKAKNLNLDYLQQIQNNLLNIIKNQSNAPRLVKSNVLKNYCRKFNIKISEITESFKIQRDLRLERLNQVLMLVLFLSAICITLIFIITILSYKAYQENLIKRFKLEKDLEQEKAQHIQSSKLASMGQLASGIAHEINNPLAIISGHLFHLRKLALADGDKEEIVKVSNKMKSTIFRIAKIIKSLQTFSKEGNNDEFVKYDLGEILDETVKFCTVKLDIDNIRLILTNHYRNLLIKCQFTQFSQVLINLINNSRDAIRGTDSPWININVGEEKGYFLVSITDSGEGIDPLIVEKIFDPFFTTKGVGEGTGLGLGLSKGIIEQHDGQLIYNSNSINTQFIIKVPKFIEKSKLDETEKKAS